MWVEGLRPDGASGIMAPTDIELEEQSADVQTERVMDGYASLIADKRGAWLFVAPPEGGGHPVNAEVVERELRARNVENVDWDRVRRALAEARGEPQWILNGIDPDEEARKAAAAAAEEAARPKPVDKSPFVFITLSEDQVSAKLTLVPPEDRTIDLTFEDVQKVIADNGITYGLLEERLDEVRDILDRIRDGDWTEPVETEIAHGDDPEQGQDAVLEYLFDKPSGEPKAKAGDDSGEGRVDYFAVKDIENIKRGAAIARRFPPTMGVAGKSVKGEVIPARDGVETMEIGGGVETALGNENILVASIDGQVKIEGSKLTVQALYEIDGDVDLKTGSVDFIGTVMVKGNVQPGFKITAGEDVIVEGVVDDAEIHAAGKVTIKGGVLGQGGKAKIVAGGDVTAKYIRNAAIETKGVLTAHEGVLQCHVSAFAIKLTGKRGQIVGGELAAETDIVANSIGSSSSATPTVLMVGNNPARQAEIHTLTEEIKKGTEELDKHNKAVTALKAMKDRAGSLPPDKNQLLMTSMRAKMQLEKDLTPMTDRLQQMMAEDEEQRKKVQAKISVVGTMYPGVKLQIRGAKKNIVEETRYVTFTEKGSEIKQGSFK